MVEEHERWKCASVRLCVGRVSVRVRLTQPRPKMSAEMVARLSPRPIVPRGINSLRYSSP